jgi:prepilin-type N-terminal cleavage/methylation domain-containing protein
VDTRQEQEALSQRQLSRSRGSSQKGFTFIEVIIALSLLAVSTAVLIGLEGSTVQRTIRDRSVQQSMLAARRVLAAVEAADTKLELSDQNDVPVIDLLRTLNAAELANDAEKGDLETLRASVKIQDWPLPLQGVAQNALRKLVLDISWGSDPRDVFEITYFIPGPEEESE